MKKENLGQIRGSITNSETIGNVTINTEFGIYGKREISNKEYITEKELEYINKNENIYNKITNNLI